MDEKRQELYKLASRKEISYTQAKLKKMSDEEISQIYEDYKKDCREEELDEINESFSDLVIAKFDDFMKKYNFVSQESDLGKKLQGRKLFRQDVKYFVSYVTPFIPFIGLLDGGLVVAEEMFDHYTTTKDDDASSTTEEGREQSETSTSDHDKE